MLWVMLVMACAIVGLSEAIRRARKRLAEKNAAIQQHHMTAHLETWFNHNRRDYVAGDTNDVFGLWFCGVTGQVWHKAEAVRNIAGVTYNLYFDEAEQLAMLKAAAAIVEPPPDDIDLRDVALFIQAAGKRKDKLCRYER